MFPKKDGKARVCVNFRDLNKANPKVDFPLPQIDMLVVMSLKLIYFFIHFSCMFLTVSALFVCQIMEHSLCFAGVN